MRSIRLGASSVIQLFADERVAGLQLHVDFGQCAFIGTDSVFLDLLNAGYALSDSRLDVKTV